MARVITRTGEKSFTVTDESPTEGLAHLEADFSVSPPQITATLRFVSSPTETWAQIDALLTQLGS